MAVIATDDFERGDGPLGANWSALDGTMVIVSTVCKYGAGSLNDASVLWTADSWPNDQYGQVAVDGIASGDDGSGFGVILRCTDINNHYRVVVNGNATNNITIAKKTTAGGYQVIGQRTQAWTGGDVLYVEIVGTTMKVKHNGTQMGADITDTSLSSGDVGLLYSSTNAEVQGDNFEGGSVGATAQVLAPSADSVDGTWTDQAGGTSLAAAIDEATASDTDYIRSELGPANSACRVKLASGGDPASSTGHIIHWRAGKDTTGGATIGMTVKLYQGGGNSIGGGTLIASFTRSNVDAFTTYDETLSSGEADSITNYSDLYLEFSANQT